MDAPGHVSGHGNTPFDWGRYVGDLVGVHGSLAAVATRLAEERGFVEDTGSIERGLRRLRARGNTDGGVWGRRCLRAFGIPDAVEARVRWMGHYHTRFTDLPRSICLDLLRPWDAPPVSESPSRAWVQLGLCSVALRGGETERAEDHLVRAEAAATGAAAVEAHLVRAFVASRVDSARMQASLEAVEPLLDVLPEDPDRACLFARWIDQRGWVLNRLEKRYAEAEVLYASIPAEGPAFARVRRHNGLGWAALKRGAKDEAREHARVSVSAAGDSGSLRLRAMALNLLARTLDGDGAEEVRDRARAIADRLEDEILRLRFR